MVLPSFSYLKKNKLFHRCPVKKTEARKGREWKGAGVKTEAVGGVGEPRLRLKNDGKRKTSVTDQRGDEVIRRLDGEAWAEKTGRGRWCREGHSCSTVLVVILHKAPTFCFFWVKTYRKFFSYFFIVSIWILKKHSNRHRIWQYIASCWESAQIASLCFF